MHSARWSRLFVIALAPLAGSMSVGCSLLADLNGLAQSSDGGEGRNVADATVDARPDESGGGDAAATGGGDAGQVVAIAEDDFERTVSPGFSDAPRGGPWRVIAPNGEVEGFSVDGHRGVMLLRETAAVGAYLAVLEDVARDDVEVAVTFATDRLPVNGPATLAAYARLRPDDNYVCNVSLRSSGDVHLVLQGQAAGTTIPLTTDGPFLTATAARTKLRLRFQVFGLSPTTLRAKVWVEGTPEPATWQIQASDSSPVLQTKGTVGVAAHVGTAVTNMPVTAFVDDLLVRPASLLPN